MPRPSIQIPDNDIKGLQTLLSEGKTHQQIAEYYISKGIIVSRQTISNKIRDMENPA